MLDGFVKVAAVTPEIKVADCIHNSEVICEQMEQAVQAGAKIVVFPELCVTGYTCEDLFWQELLLREADAALERIITCSRDKDALFFVGVPWVKTGKLYNTAAVITAGKLLGVIPKRFLPNYGEFYEVRHFQQGQEAVEWITYKDQQVPFGMNQIFSCRELPGLRVAAEICEDLWAPMPPSTRHAMAGATVLVNLSASDEVTGKNAYRRSLIEGQSARLVCAYIYANAGEGESTTDLVFSGHNLIAENGMLLKQSELFASGMITAEIDISRMISERRRMTTYMAEEPGDYVYAEFSLQQHETRLSRKFPQTPFVPAGERDRAKRCEEILAIQAMGLKKRLAHTGAKSAVVGISGGLDSTLALLVTVKAFDLLELPRKQITAVTMPCFGTTDRTYTNACELTLKLGAQLREVDIKEAVTIHFRDIGHDPENHDVTYENSQARERTQVLMDIANQTGGLVIGTGDMSELALGWATYNGDHMSMYGVNASVPKTLVRHLVAYCADASEDQQLAATLRDILDTPVSPELLPPKDGKIAQKTEDLVGPYELHDFFLYYILRFGYAPKKVYRIAVQTFAEIYDGSTILKWLQVFYRRFFSQQFKRSCLPDGPKVGSVSVSPRGDLRMPSDACVRMWSKELEEL